ncbi:MAG: FkbM family methyltransferase [Bacteroidia bacterium]|nr:FkbM family methyltransferase [Bacteroidia bacterium]
MRWLYLLKLLRVYRRLRRISSAPFLLLLRALRGVDQHNLCLFPGVSRLCHITPPNLYGFLLLREAGMQPASVQPEAPELLAWELSPGRTFLTRLTVGMDLMTLYELFGRKDYGEDFSGKVVVDVGAYNGDSTVYFALQGARQVIGLEPYPPNYALAQENITRMGLSDRILLLPAALGTDEGQAAFQIAPKEPDANSLTPPSSPLQKFIRYEEQISVEVLSLSALLNRFDLEEVDFLKLDCEGCEFSLIESLSPMELRRVRTWHIEYHANPKPLIDKLSGAGFSVEKRLDRGFLGYLIGERRDVQ